MSNGHLRRIAISKATAMNDITDGMPAGGARDIARCVPQNTPTPFKRRADSVAGCRGFFPNGGRKKRKKEHKKFKSKEEAEDYAISECSSSENSGPGGDRDTPAPDTPSLNTYVRSLKLKCPKVPTDGVGDNCRLCQRPKLAIKAESCSKCGRRQFCCKRCKEEFKEKYCCDQCRQENYSDSDDEDEKEQNGDPFNICLFCARSRDRVFEYGFSCRHCGERKFCIEVCREAYGLGFCSAECSNIAENAINDLSFGEGECVVCDDELGETAVPCPKCLTMQFCSLDCKDALGEEEYGGHCGDICLRFNGDGKAGKKNVQEDKKKAKQPGELSILDDPRNYENFTADVEMPDLVPDAGSDEDEELDQRSLESIIDHRLINHGRILQYHLEKPQPRSRRWANGTSLSGPNWTSKMQDYWARPKRKRERRFLEEKVGERKPAPFGRHVLCMEIEQERLFLFQTIDFTQGTERKKKHY